MKRCDYCGGSTESGCGAVETVAGLYLHYSKIECAEFLKLQVSEWKKAWETADGDRAVFKAELGVANRLVDGLQKVVEVARELIGKNIGRPEVYIEYDKGKYKLAIALLNLPDNDLKRKDE